ncbi:hypothetical protein PORY_002406 [Pneumocystis oryctolagi]|uniref:Uncharacterized protein n=1 Tax=Pneumocystis oryctolagi TaxID=42067 RepID=A0ACB7CB15_9ASCO|nr:hypothetical protein PORY_002406 [Pneumocystis oryctolagi]
MMETLAPPLPKITQGIVPLKEVVGRLIYYAFSELQSILEILPSMDNAMKKQTMLEYILFIKRQIIKLYVLVKWAHSSEEVKRCIDIVAFLQGQKNCFSNVIYALKTITDQLPYARVRSPDILTAMEVFSTGTFPRLKFSETSTAFINTNNLKSSEILKTFDTLNMLISLRLSLYQVIPYSMVFYTVENGRAKFVVENEFIIFLSFVGEDISKTDDFLWFLVDFEWNFEGAPTISDSMKDEIEKFGNEILKSSLIQKKEPFVELYNFFHKFTLLYKLETIVMEAKEMSFKEWKDKLNVSFDSFKKVLTLKYWPVLISLEKNIKSWPNSIRIFIGESNKKNILSYMFPYSRISFDYSCSVISCSWKIGDDLQCYEDLDIDESKISAKEIMSKVINSHSMILLKKIYSLLLKSDSFSSNSVFILNMGKNENPVLKIQCSKAKSILIFVKSTCGKFRLVEYDSFLCSSLVIKKYEKLINIPNQNILEILIQLKCKILYDDIESKSKFLGWEVVKFPLGSFKQKEFKDNFGLEIKYAIFLTSSILGWKETTSDSIFFAVCFLSGKNISWWLLETSVSKCDVFLGWNVLWFEKIQIHAGKKQKLEELGLSIESYFYPTYSLLESIYKYSIIRVAILQFSRDLDKRGIHYGYLHDFSISHLWIIPFFHFCTGDISPFAKVWTCKNMFAQFSFSGNSFDELKIVFYGKLNNIKFITVLMQQYKKDYIELNVKSNYFLIKVIYKMGKNISLVIDLFLELWLKIETVIRFVFKSNEFNHFLVLETFSIDIVRFSYYKKKHFWLEIGYGSSDQKVKFPSIKYSLEIGSIDGYTNPHNRIKTHLCQMLDDSRGDIRLFSEIVYKTLPFLETIEQLEAMMLEKSEFHVLFQSSLQFSIVYVKRRYALGVILRSVPSHLLRNDMITLNEGTLVYYIFDLALKYQTASFLETCKTKARDFESSSVESQRNANTRARNLNYLKSTYNVIEACQSIWSKGIDVGKEHKKTIFPIENGLLCTSDIIGSVVSKIHTMILGYRNGQKTEWILKCLIKQSFVDLSSFIKRLNMEQMSDITEIQKVFSACIGAFVTSVVVTPFDLIKTRLQSQTVDMNIMRSCCRDILYSSSHSQNVGSLSCALHPDVVLRHFCVDQAIDVSRYQLNGMLETMIRISRNEGFTALWRGLSPTLVMALPSTVIYFVGYDHLRQYFSSPIAPLFCGAFSRAMSATVISPLELFKVRLQSAVHCPNSTSIFSTVIIGIQDMVKTQGLQSLWKGLSPTLWRDVPFSGFYWMGYERIKSFLTNYAEPFKSLNPRTSEFVKSFISGGISGSIASLITHPFDSAKTRRQIRYNSLGTMSSIKESTWKVMNDIFNESGVRGLFRGAVPRMLKVSPACSIMISSYEFGKMFFSGSLNL